MELWIAVLLWCACWLPFYGMIVAADRSDTKMQDIWKGRTMESLRDVDRVMQREIKKGSTPLQFENVKFGNDSYHVIASQEKLIQVLSCLLRVGEYEAFAGKMMGDGAAVIPDDEYVYAPADGTVTFVFPTKHAIGFQTDGGHEMLIHVGIDTVSLSGDSFEAFVHDGDHVRTGDKLLKADIQEIKDKVPSLASPVLFTDLPDCLEVHILKRGKIRSGEPFLELHNKEKQEVG